MHFGLGNQMVIDELIIDWQNGTQEKLTNIQVNQIVILEEKNAQKTSASNSKIKTIF